MPYTYSTNNTSSSLETQAPTTAGYTSPSVIMSEVLNALLQVNDPQCPTDGPNQTLEDLAACLGRGLQAHIKSTTQRLDVLAKNNDMFFLVLNAIIIYRKYFVVTKIVGPINITDLPLDKMAAILADDIFRCIFVNEKFCILIENPLKVCS